MSPLVRRFLAFSSLLATVAVPLPASADAMPPPQDCEDQSVGDRCTNAGVNADESGLCLEEMCTAPCDGGSCEGSCMLCEVIGSGSGASRGSSGSTSTSTGKSERSGTGRLGSGSGAASGDAGNHAPPATGSGGCTAASGGAGASGGGYAVALGALVLCFARRRRPR